MGKWYTGGAAALAIWIGSAMAAEAQGINVTTTGPSLVYHTDTQCTVTGVVTGVSAYYYNVTIKVDGVIKHNFNYMGSGTNLSRTVTGMGTWAMQPGQAFDTKLTLNSYGKTHTLSITVSEGLQTRLQPADRKAAPKPAALKEEELCLAGSAEEAAA